VKKKIILPLLAFAILASLFFPRCDVPDFREMDDIRIKLIWNKSYPTQTGADVMRGLIWDLSWLGAELPAGSFDAAVTYDAADSTRFTLNIDSLGFSETGRAALFVICDSIMKSEEYKKYGGIDVGKFVTLTLGTSWHYYRITGVPETLEEFRWLHRLDSSYTFGVTQSSISEGHRRILFSRDTSLFSCGFVGEEGMGSLSDGTFRPEIFECFDFMPNGQLRFMIYDAGGRLTSGTPAELGDAGKPAKCLWCHETAILPLFIGNTPVPNMLTNEEFLAIRDSMQSRLERYRLTLNTDMNWKDRSSHTKGELLYITYMEPTKMHLMNEWGLSEADVNALMRQEDAERFREFDYIGDVYTRSGADARFHDSLPTLPYPVSVRETASEVNYFRQQ
jgi:hypothetical protein